MRALVIGCGHIGSRRARILKELGFELGLLDSRDITPLCKELGADNISERGKMLADVCLVCTPPDSHLNYATNAAALGCNVFIEKPLSDSFDEAAITKLVEALQANGKWAMMGNSYRFLPSLREFRARFTDYPLVAAEIWSGQHLEDWHPLEDYKNSYSAKIGVGYESLAHSLDLANWLFGDIESICALGGTTGQITTMPESVSCLLQMKSGAQVSVHADYWQRPRDSHINVVVAKFGDTRFSWTFDPKEADAMYCKEMKAMKRALELDLCPQPDIYQGISTLEAINAASESSRDMQWKKQLGLWQRLAGRTQ